MTVEGFSLFVFLIFFTINLKGLNGNTLFLVEHFLLCGILNACHVSI